MKAISRTAPILFLLCMMAISVVPAFASASDPSAPAIYFSAESIFGGTPVTTAFGFGFTPSSTITFTCSGVAIQTVPSPLVADSSGGFTALLMTGKLGGGSCTVTATDGTNTAQSTLTMKDHGHDPKPPQRCNTSYSPDGACCGPLAAFRRHFLLQKRIWLRRSLRPALTFPRSFFFSSWNLASHLMTSTGDLLFYCIWNGNSRICGRFG